MGGPSTHGQRNKAHKSGAHAGKSAREKQKLGKEGAPHRVNVKASTVQASKAERARAAQQFRDAKRHELLEKRRRGGPPVVVAILPLSDAVETAALWGGLTAACDKFGKFGQQPTGASDVDMATLQEPQGMLTLGAAGHARLRLTLLPPPQDRQDLLSIVDLGKAADVLMLVVPGAEGLQTVDADGEAALAVLRALGMPGVLGVVQGSAGGRRDMKERAAAKKRGEKALAAQISGDVKVMHMDGPEDATALVRYLADHTPSVPLWRQHRPSLLLESADFAPSSEDPVLGTLRLCGFVRHAGLSANGLLVLPGVGDFQIAAIEGPQDPHVPAHVSRGKGGVMEVEMGGDAGAVPVLAVPDPESREAVIRENAPDTLANEQTWPTDEELADADVFQRAKHRKRVPAGTSEYQAAWILDEEDEEGDGQEDVDEEGDAEMHEERMACDDGEPPELAGDAEALVDDDDDDFDARTTGTTAMEEEMTEGEGTTDRLRAEFEAIKRKRRAEADDEAFPDEVDTPIDVPARVRFQRYRGLKSFRTSPWDPKEGLPQHYARVFAFENFKRAQWRAREALARATSGADPCAVTPGTYVRVVVPGVPADRAADLLGRVSQCLQGCGPPVVAFGLLQHESRLSVLNVSVRKATNYHEPIANKEELLFVTGIRSFPANPIYSSDDLNASKHRMERFLRAGQHCMASVIAPISYPPLPLLAFKMTPGQRPRLAASGAVRSCDPDRITVKKIVVSGYPVRVHKRKATVRFMFHNPEDIRWFQKLDLWTKHGRRGRIVESLGTHGAMKCSFDGVIQQQDSVCASLYKRVFPKWPSNLTFA